MTTEGLTRREREVLEKIMLGLMNKEIASDLGITERTVKAHRAMIFRKCRVVNAAQLVRKMMAIV